MPLSPVQNRNDLNFGSAGQGLHAVTCFSLAEAVGTVFRASGNRRFHMTHPRRLTTATRLTMCD